jgi:hypothetical protein
MSGGLFQRMKRWWTDMFFPATEAYDNGAHERHSEIRKAVHENRNLVTRLQSEARQSAAMSKRANFAAHEAIKLLEEARKRDEESPP